MTLFFTSGASSSSSLSFSPSSAPSSSDSSSAGLAILLEPGLTTTLFLFFAHLSSLLLTRLFPTPSNTRNMHRSSNVFKR